MRYGLEIVMCSGTSLSYWAYDELRMHFEIVSKINIHFFVDIFGHKIMDVELNLFFLHNSTFFVS